MVSRDHELAIDLVRGIAALLVLIAHVVTPALEMALGADHSQWSTSWLLVGATLGSGAFWVRCFFVVSGLCIHLSITRSMEKGGLNLRHYALARFTRIYPMFLVGLGIAVLAWWLDASKDAAFPIREFGGSLLMLQHFTGAFPAYGASWSLTPEFLYYLAWPLALVACKGNQRNALQRSAGITLVVTLVIVAVWKLAFAGDQTHWLIPFWVISGLYVVWLGGAWLAVEWKRVQSWITPQVWVGGIAWVLALFLVEAVLTVFHARSWMFMVADYLATPGFVVLLAGGRYCRLSWSPRWTSIARWMGMFSYPCYLLHGPLIALILSTTKRLGLQAHPSLIFVETLVIIAMLGVVLERYIMRKRSQFLKGLV